MVRKLIDALTAEFAAAIEAVVGGPVSLSPSTPAARGAGWSTKVAVTGSANGSVALWVSDEAAVTLAKRVMGFDEAPDTATVADMLREMWAQSAGAVSLKDEFTGIGLVVAMPEAAELMATAAASFELQLPDGLAGQLAGTGDVAEARVAPQPETTAPTTSAGGAASPAASNALANPKLEMVLDIDLPLIVRFGRTVMTLKALSGLGPGSIVDMGRSPDEPVEMLVGERVIARGEVVIVGGNYGIRITDLVSPAERVRALEA